MSGWLLLGVPGAVLIGGLSESWIVIGLVIGAYCNWTLVAPRLRTMSGGARTLPQLFAQRFPRRARTIGLISTALVLLFFGVYTAAGFVAGAKLFSASFGLSYDHALLLGAAIIMSYTALGGFLAVSWTDVLQASLMMAALGCVPALALTQIEWIPLGEHASLTQGVSAIGIVSLLAWGLGYFGQPHILARFMALDPSASVQRARFTGIAWMIASCLGAIAVGLVGFMYASQSSAPADAEVIFIHLTRAVLSPWVAGFVLAAILAAVMSTIDSQLLVASTALTEDVVRRVVPSASDVQLMRVGRVAVLLVAASGIWIAANPERGVLELVSRAWAGLGATFGPAILATLYLRSTTSTAVVAGMTVGGAMVVIWPYGSGPLFEFYELLPAFVASLAVIVFVSRLSGSEPSAVEAFDRLSLPRPRSDSSRSG